MTTPREHMTPTVDLLKRLPVESSAVRSIGYDPETMTLDIEYHPPEGEELGAVWRHVGPSLLDYETLIGAESIGKALPAIRKAWPGVQVAGPLPKKKRGAE